MVSFIFNEAMRDLRRAGRLGVSAILLIALSLTALGGFWLLSVNLGRAIALWGDRVRVIAYLKEEPPAGRLEDLLRRIQAVGGVQRLRFVSKAEALSVLKRSLGSEAEVAEMLPRNPLPASVEITPDAAIATPEGTRALVARLAALPEVDEVQGGSQWVDGLAQFRRLFQGVGLVIGAVLAVAAILTVTTATTLVLHLRRDEMEIMRLVGATENVIRWPRLLQGMAQGLVAAIVALATLEFAYAVAVPRLEPLLPVTIGLERVAFLSPVQALALIGAGTMLGAIGGLLARGRVPA
ncbi:MAG TPA: ABC transporter permease [Methylomirabilota bacterium]|nr:ABC transporter permease [Methylomirabilota bacterium]